MAFNYFLLLFMLKYVVSFVSPNPSYSPVCPGDTVVFTCIASGTGSTFWRVKGGVAHRLHSGNEYDVIDSFTLNVIEINGTTVVSTATVQTVTLQLNGASISCSANLQGPYITQSINIAGPPDVVNNVTIIPVNSTSAILSWSPGYYCVVNYTVAVLSSSTCNTDQYDTSDNTTSIIIKLVTGVQYLFTATARDSYGRIGPPSQLLNYTWDVPLQVINITWFSISNTDTELIWLPQEDISRPSILYYIVTNPLTNTVINTTNTSVIITGLTPGQYYNINITAVNIIGAGPIFGINVMKPRIVTQISSDIPTTYVTPYSISKLFRMNSILLSPTSTTYTTSIITSIMYTQSTITSLVYSTVMTTISTTDHDNSCVTTYAVSIPVSMFLSSLLTAIVITFIVYLIMRRRSYNRDTPPTTTTQFDPIYNNINLQEKEIIELQGNTAYGYIN